MYLEVDTVHMAMWIASVAEPVFDLNLLASETLVVSIKFFSVLTRKF